MPAGSVATVTSDLLTTWSDDPDDPTRRDRRRLGKLLAGDLTQAVGGGSPAGAAAVRLLIAGEPVALADLDGGLGASTIDLGRRLGLVSPIDVDGTPYLRATALIAPVDLGDDMVGWVAFDPPWEQRDDRVPGPGNASDTLIDAIAVEDAAVAADIGTGCGYVALHLAQFADRVIATDINPRALCFAELTGALNGLLWDLRLGSYLEPIADTRVDLVVANPAFVVGNPDAVSVFRDGDADLAVRLTDQLAGVLPLGGCAQFLGNWVYRDDPDPTAADPTSAVLAAAEGLDALIIERAIVDPGRYAALWVEPDSPDHADWVAHLEASGIEAIGTGIVTLRRPTEGPTHTGVARLLEATDEPLGPAIAEWLDNPD